MNISEETSTWFSAAHMFSALRGMGVALETLYLLYTKLEEDITSGCLL